MKSTEYIPVALLTLILGRGFRSGQDEIFGVDL